MQGSRCTVFTLISFAALAALIACSSSPEASRAPASSGPMEFAFAKLRARGASESFLQLIQQEYREEERIKVLDLNLLGFLKSRPEQNERIPGHELRRVQKFLKENKKVFREAEKKFPVPKEVIASLLWVETKYGRDTGRYHVASSFFSLAQADYPTILDQTMELARERSPDFTREIEQKVIERSKTKAEWAVEELVALQEVHEKGFKNAIALEGSFSGAFGMAQFLPSSYLSWSKGHKKQPNLFRADDSIFSVANYLTVNGWKKIPKESQQAALFHYNRDINYVNRILRMSDCLRSPAKRKLWQRRSSGSC